MAVPASSPTAPEATPTFRRYPRSGGEDKVQILTVETSQHVVLTKASGFSRDGTVCVPISAGADFDLEVYADEVTIVGDIALPERSITVVARKLTAESDTGAKTVNIVVSGAGGASPPNKIPAGTAKDQYVNGIPIATAIQNVVAGKGRKIVVGKADQFGNRVDVLEDAANSDGSQGWSAVNHEQMNGRSGNKGDEGKNGGNITLVIGELIGETLHLKADGGAGGAGQAGQDGLKGGDGGPGADALWAGAFQGSSYAASDGGAAGNGAEGGLGGTGGSGGTPGTVSVLVSACRKPAGIRTSLEAGFPGDDGANGNPGGAGTAGRGGKGYRKEVDEALWKPDFLRLIQADGHDGAPGKSGTDDRVPHKTWTIAGRKWTGFKRPVLIPSGTPEVHIGESAAPADMAARASLGWLQLMLEKIRLDYLRTDPVKDVDGFKQLGESINWLVSTLSLKNSGTPQNAKGKKALESALNSAWALSRNHSSGRDAFGMAPCWVPTMSVSGYLSEGQSAVAILKQLEGKASTFWSSAAKAQVTSDGLDLSAAEIGAAVNNLTDAIKKTKADIARVKVELERAESARATAKSALVEVLGAFETAVSDVFELDPATLLNCLSQMSFAGGSLPGSTALIASQVGIAALDAATNIRDDTGQPVNKKYLIGQLKSFVGDEWHTAVSENADGFIDDTASYRYIDEIGRIRELIDRFSQRKELAGDTTAAGKSLDDYVDIVDRRNRFVDQFNDGIRRLAGLQGELERLTERGHAIANKKAVEADLGLADWADYLDGLAGQLRTLCLGYLGRAYRAATFWCLQEPGSLQSWLVGNPGAVESAGLSSAFANLKADLEHFVEESRKVPNLFPALPRPGRSPRRQCQLAAGWGARRAHPNNSSRDLQAAEAEQQRRLRVAARDRGLRGARHPRCAHVRSAMGLHHLGNERYGGRPRVGRESLPWQGKREVDAGPGLDGGDEYQQRQSSGRPGTPRARAVADKGRRAVSAGNRSRRVSRPRTPDHHVYLQRRALCVRLAPRVRLGGPGNGHRHHGRVPDFQHRGGGSGSRSADSGVVRTHRALRHLAIARRAERQSEAQSVPTKADHHRLPRLLRNVQPLSTAPAVKPGPSGPTRYRRQKRSTPSSATALGGGSRSQDRSSPPMWAGSIRCTRSQRFSSPIWIAVWSCACGSSGAAVCGLGA